MRLHVMTGDFQNSLKIIEPITFDALSVFSKAVPSYISLFYYTGFSYLMNKRKSLPAPSLCRRTSLQVPQSR